ncbi:MAG: hypothetical protein HYW22_02515 [Candidatus Aenigmarchaeota archaeon]|nr:hypothetical protein [Candidatus Aenigmarchaeota archaeon]
MKGQMFLLTAAIIVTVLISLKAYVNLQQISNQRDILNVNLDNLVFQNIVNEITNVLKYSSLTPNVMSDNAVDFINFTRNGTQHEGYTLNGIFVGAKVNSTNQTMNITVLNFRNENGVNFTVKLNTSSPQINYTTLNDFNLWTNNFTFTKGDTYNLTISLPDKGYEQNITIQTKENKDVYVGFYDFKLSTENAVYRKIFQQTFKIPK